MDKTHWKHTQHSLRKLLHAFNEEDEFTRKVEYCLALEYNPMFDWFHLWDAYVKMTLATIRLDEDKTILRFLPEGILVPQIQKLKIDDTKTILVPSNNVTKHDGWVMNRVQRKCEREIERYEDFLAQESQPSNLSSSYSISIAIPQLGLDTNLGVFGDIAEVQEQRVQVLFQSREEMELYSGQAMEAIRRLVRSGSHIRDVISFTELIQTLQQQDMRQAEANAIMRRREREMRSALYSQMPMYHQETASYMGRPMEQIQEYMNSTVNSARALTETDLMRAVEALDEQNVPREGSRWDRGAISRLVERMRDA